MVRTILRTITKSAVAPQRGKASRTQRGSRDTFLPAYSPHQFIDHSTTLGAQRTGCVELGLCGLLMTFGFPWANVGCCRGTWSRVGLGTVCDKPLLRASRSDLTTTMRCLGDTQALRNLLLLPVRDIIAPVIWAWASGESDLLAGRLFYLKNGRLERIADEAAGEQEIPRLSRS